MTYARLTERATVREVALSDHAPLEWETLDAGAMASVMFTLADQDGWNGEALCIAASGKAYAIPEEKLEPLLT